MWPFSRRPAPVSAWPARAVPGRPPGLVSGNTAFALDLYARLRQKPGNLFLSPFSISTALAMTAAGARGTTLDEMRAVLHLPENPGPAFGELLGRVNGPGGPEARSYQLRAANAIWAQQGEPWRAEFKDHAREYYGAGLVETDFRKPEAARRAINTWAERETGEKIKDLIPPGVIDPLTLMVLTNAVYFKGDWAKPFKKMSTGNRPFTVADGTKTDVPLMTQTGTFGHAEFTYRSDSESSGRGQVLELPYTDETLSMLVFLPRGELGELEQHLSADALSAWTQAIDPERVEVFLPRFKLETSDPLRLVDPLKALGMRAAFGPADFSGMHPGPEKPFISEILHKAFVDVNEEGTEATAATAVMMLRSGRSTTRPIVFRADRPFLFLIRENTTGTILFLGRCSNPKG